jgi:hypothetical protein
MHNFTHVAQEVTAVRTQHSVRPFTAFVFTKIAFPGSHFVKSFSNDFHESPTKCALVSLVVGQGLTDRQKEAV